MQDNAQVLEALERIESAVLASAVPPPFRWLSAAQVAALLGMSVKHLAERVAFRPDFPKPSRPGGPKGERKWRMDEVQRYMEQNREVKR